MLTEAPKVVFIVAALHFGSDSVARVIRKVDAAGQLRVDLDCLGQSSAIAAEEVDGRIPSPATITAKILLGLKF